MSETIIYHNPACSTSRKALDVLNAAGLKPTVIAYLKVGWTKPQLKSLLAQMRREPRDILRTRGGLAEELGLTDAAAGAEALLDAMVANPVLVERPIVVTPKGARLARPIEKLDEIL